MVTQSPTTNRKATQRTEQEIKLDKDLKIIKLKAKDKVQRLLTMNNQLDDTAFNKTDFQSEYTKNGETNRTFTQFNEGNIQDSRQKRILENIAEIYYRGTLSKAQLDKTIEYNMSSPLKNHIGSKIRFESQVSALNESSRKKATRETKTA